MKSQVVTETETVLLKKINVLQPQAWSSSMPALYGEDEVRQLRDLFGISFAVVRQTYIEDFKGNPGIGLADRLLKLQQVVKSIAVSSADFERGFSEINITVTPLRTQLKIQMVSVFMFISLVGPPLHKWNAKKFAKKWVLKRRSADHVACPQRRQM